MSALTPFDGAQSLPEALAEELVRASRMLNDLAYELGTDEIVLRRHMQSLQTVDHISQIQLAVADLLRHLGDTDRAIAGITLEDMAERLQGYATAPRAA